jgi:hypothetical protein
MSRLSTLLSAGLISLTATCLLPTRAAAYPVDCAILLCLAGGWPASAECAHARAVFIARITPWPIEPPLQIWNCPMRASFPTEARPMDRLFDIAFPAENTRPLFSKPEALSDFLRVQDAADVDISDPAFDFVRSIRVFEITFQQHRNSDGDCNTWSAVYEGGYGEQGDYIRRRSSPSAIPEASDFSNPPYCGTYRHRSVFVEWRDFEGTYGHEEVHY